MRSKAAIINLDDLETWFMSTESSNWNLYRGHQEKLNSTHLIASQRAEMSAEESWGVLRDSIERNTRAGGEVTIYIPMPNRNNGFLQHYSNMPVGAAGVGGTPAAGMGAWGMGFIPVDEAERRLKQAQEMWELKREIEDLRAEKESGVGFWEGVGREMLSGIDVNGLLQLGTAYLAQRMMGSGGPVPTAQPVLNGHQVSNNEELEEFDHEEYFLDRVRSGFSSDEEFYSFLKKVGDFFESNKELCKGFFNQTAQ